MLSPWNALPASLCNAAACPNDCSGHGKCVSIKTMAGETRAFPMNFNNYTYGEPGVRFSCSVLFALCGRLIHPHVALVPVRV